MLCEQAQQNQDNVMWEENRLLQSGVVRRTNVNEDEEKDLVRVQIIVMDIKPPFLDGRMVSAFARPSRFSRVCSRSMNNYS